MTDIVKRLRAPAYWMSGSDEGHEGDNEAPREAADLIEALRAEVERLAKRLEVNHDAPAYDGIACRDETIRLQDRQLDVLRAENTRLREALDEIFNYSGGAMCACADPYVMDRARAALAQKEMTE